MTKILSIGEVMLEMSDVGDGLYKKSFAGDSFNMAYYLNLVTGGRINTEYMTAVGNDAESNACLDFIGARGVITTKCLRDPDRSIGLFILSNDENGEKQYCYWRGQSAARHLFDQCHDLSGYDLIFLTGITAAITKNKQNMIESISKAKQKGVQLAYDLNHRAKLWDADTARAIAMQLFPMMNIVKISNEELEFLYPDKQIAEFSNEYPQAEWVLTCGSDKGEVWKDGTLLAKQLFGGIEKVVDSSAAGDSFIATYIAEKFTGASPLESLRQAHAVASQVVCAKGSIVDIDIPRR